MLLFIYPIPQAGQLPGVLLVVVCSVPFFFNSSAVGFLQALMEPAAIATSITCRRDLESFMFFIFSVAEQYRGADKQFDKRVALAKNIRTLNIMVSTRIKASSFLYNYFIKNFPLN
jgi:hypothetical protein